MRKHLRKRIHLHRHALCASIRAPRQPVSICRAALNAIPTRPHQVHPLAPIAPSTTAVHIHRLLRFSPTLAPTYVHISSNAIVDAAISATPPPCAPSAHCAHPFKRRSHPSPSQRLTDITLAPATRAAAAMPAPSMRIRTACRLTCSGKRGCSVSAVCFILQS